MSKNPILNALAAGGYIAVVAGVMFWGSKMGGDDNSILAPIAMISLFTLSAAVMGYIFLFEPAQLYFGGKKKEGVDLFLKTLLGFSVMTFGFLAWLFLVR